MRKLNIAVAQLGPVEPDESRTHVVGRMLGLMQRAAKLHASLVVYPELTLTTFFPRHYMEDQAQIDQWFETEMPGPEVQPLFDTAARLGIGFTMGYAERVESNTGKPRHFNTSILVAPDGQIVGKYRKVHLPGHAEHEPWRPFQHLEKRYFEPGDLGFGVWPFLGANTGMCICNDRRWPETWRVLGLKGAELVTLGYNTPTHYPPVPQHDHLQSFHHLLPMQAGAYQNGTYIAAAAKAGVEDGSILLGHSCIIAPTGEIIALSHTNGDELIQAEIDLDRCQEIKQHIFNFSLHRQPQHYGIIAENPTPPAAEVPLLNTHVKISHTANASRQQTPIATDSPLSAAHADKARQTISRWPGYQETPLVSLSGMAKRLSVGGVWYKDEASRFGLGSFKSLGGAYAVQEIITQYLADKLGKAISAADLESEANRHLVKEVTVTCATDGNHGRSVAWGAKRWGCPCIIYIHKDVSEGRKAAIEAYGASVIRVNGNYDDSVRKAAEDAETHGRIVVSDTSWPGYLDIPSDVMRGYTVLADEALNQLGNTQPTHVFLQGGVGGLAAAVTARIRDRLGPAIRIVVVEPENAACIYESIRAGSPVAVTGDLETIMAGLSCGEVSLVAFELLKQQIDDVLVIPDSAAIRSMQLLAEGVDGDKPLVAGESAVGGLAGFLLARHSRELSDKLGLNETSQVLFIGSEGATDPQVYQELVGRSPSAVLQQC